MVISRGQRATWRLEIRFKKSTLSFFFSTAVLLYLWNTLPFLFLLELDMVGRMNSWGHFVSVPEKKVDLLWLECVGDSFHQVILYHRFRLWLPFVISLYFLSVFSSSPFRTFFPLSSFSILSTFIKNEKTSRSRKRMESLTLRGHLLKWTWSKGDLSRDIHLFNLIISRNSQNTNYWTCSTSFVFSHCRASSFPSPPSFSHL